MFSPDYGILDPTQMDSHKKDSQKNKGKIKSAQIGAFYYQAKTLKVSLAGQIILLHSYFADKMPTPTKNL
jgi:hypothetical protein